MDEQRVEASVKDAAGKVGDTVSDLAAQPQANVQGKLDQGKAMFQDLKASTEDAVERATAVARDLSTAGTEAAAQASEVIQGVARQVGNQGVNAKGYLSRYAAEQPLSTLLLAAAFGYGLAYLIHRR